MKAAIFKGPGVIKVGERPDPVIQEPADAVVRIVLDCVCGSDLWYYRQGEAVRVPQAGGTLVSVPGSGHSDETLRSLLALSDVMSTGHHAAAAAGVKKGDNIGCRGGPAPAPSTSPSCSATSGTPAWTPGPGSSGCLSHQ